MKSLITALIKAQSEFAPIKKERENPFFKSKYADLEAVIEGTKQALKNNELAVVQTFGIIDGKNTLKTSLYHSSGDSISGEQLINDSSDPQKVASASTYARRYGLLAILGIAAEEDDDGNIAANKTTTPPKQTTQTPKDNPKPQIVKDTLLGTCTDARWNEAKKRSEYTIMLPEVGTGEYLDILVMIKKPLIEAKQKDIQLINHWTDVFKNKQYHFAEDIQIVEAQQEVPF